MSAKTNNSSDAMADNSMSDQREGEDGERQIDETHRTEGQIDEMTEMGRNSDELVEGGYALVNNMKLCREQEAMLKSDCCQWRHVLHVLHAKNQ